VGRVCQWHTVATGRIGPGSEGAAGIQGLKRFLRIRFMAWTPAFAGMTS
jgi:hypothetical protein